MHDALKWEEKEHEGDKPDLYSKSQARWVTENRDKYRTYVDSPEPNEQSEKAADLADEDFADFDDNGEDITVEALQEKAERKKVQIK